MTTDILGELHDELVSVRDAVLPTVKGSVQDTSTGE